jgi:hypothetical protein
MPEKGPKRETVYAPKTDPIDRLTDRLRWIEEALADLVLGRLYPECSPEFKEEMMDSCMRKSEAVRRQIRWVISRN